MAISVLPYVCVFRQGRDVGFEFHTRRGWGTGRTAPVGAVRKKTKRRSRNLVQRNVRKVNKDTSEKTDRRSTCSHSSRRP